MLSWLASALRLVRLVFPLTIRGLAILLLAAGLLVEGLFRADLAGLFWGSSFLLFTIYALAAGHLFRLAAARSLSVSLHLPARGLAPGEEEEAAASARLPRSFPPGFSVRVFLPLAWHGRRITDIRRRLPPGESQCRIPFSAARRGIYQGTALVVEAHDVLGLSAHRITVARKDTVVVFPEVVPARELTGLVEQSDEAAPDSRRRRRSEELLEARKYYPGDDVRRLNWKVFAHTDELFLRIGEEVPPPESRILFVLDTTANPLVPHAARDSYLDSLVRSCASVMVHMVRRGLEVTLSAPGQRECRAFGAGAEAGLLAALAAAWWTDAPWAPDLPGRMAQAVVFSSAGSPGLASIMAALRVRGWRTDVFLQDLPSARPFALPRLVDLVLLSEAPAARRQRTRRRDLQGFARALSRDLELYHGTAVD
ncbi:MAG TPA: DUF58 domain-containing protein [Spirochaetia bacterium]|nr:DUF58 domain-containing protein [Spirochaetia bacterium]